MPPMISKLSTNRVVLENTANLPGGFFYDDDRSIILDGVDFGAPDGFIEISDRDRGSLLPEDHLFIDTTRVLTINNEESSFSVDGDGAVTFGVVVIGTLLQAPVFSMSLEQVGPEYVKALIETINYQNTSDTPTPIRTFSLALSDSFSATSSHTEFQVMA